jgi:hypothetical protein
MYRIRVPYHTIVILEKDGKAYSFFELFLDREHVARIFIDLILY